MRQLVKIGSLFVAALVCAGLLESAFAQYGVARPGMPTTARPAGPVPGMGAAGGVPLVLKAAPEGRKAKSPVYKVSVGTQNSSNADWWQGVVEFETSPEWIDELEFTFYAYIETQKEGAKLFRSTVNYINIPKGKHIADCFLHPNIIKRFGVPKYTAVIVKLNGAVLATKSSATTANWWEQFSPIDGVLLNRSLTPFALVDYDLYPVIKPVIPAR